MKMKTVLSPVANPHDITNRGLSLCRHPLRCKATHVWTPYVTVPWFETHGTFKVIDTITWESAAALERLKKEL